MRQVLAWLLVPQLGRQQLTLLVLCVAVAHALAANAAWALGWRRAHGRAERRWRAAAGVVGALSHVAIPCVVLWRGALIAQFGIPTTYASTSSAALVLQLLGLGEASSLLELGKGVALVAATLGLLIALWVWYGRTAPGTEAARTPVSWWAALGVAVSLQLLWAFYRGVAALYTENRLIVALVSLVAIVGPWLADPRRRRDLLTERSPLVVQEWVCALFTAYLSLSSSALWLTIVAHALWLWVGERALARATSLAEVGAPTVEGDAA
ncbi:MAG: hypothetical protein JXA09_01930 [Anaerolineae bacterium]|nr:hypothetical protein [Anaerolineae bacterium]